ncbi:unnamed protein product [Urochloa humidicola]
MEGVMVSTATGAMNSLLSKLFKLLSFEFNLFSGIRKEIEFLKNELIYMNSLLHKLANMEELDVQMHLWKNKVRELSYDIEDCIDIFMHHLGNNDEKAGLVHEATKMLKKLWVCHQVSKQIQQLKNRVVQENKRRKRYKLDEGASDPRVVEIDPRLPALYAHAGQLVGVDGPRETIISWLIEDGGRGSSQQLKIFSIVGFGGLGKTTLANQVFCKIKDKFDCTAFISVSQKPNLSKIFKDILSEIGSGVMSDPDADMQICINKIREHLTHKRTNSVECIRDLSELTNLKELSVSYSMPFGVQENPDTRILKYDVLATSLDKLGSSNLQDLDIVNSSSTPTQFWDNCFTRPRNLQRLWLPKLLLPNVPNWMVYADRLENLKKLIVQELRRDDFLVLAQLPCLMYLFLEAKKIPERTIIIQSNTFPSLKKFHFWCELSCVTFEPATMPRLQTLKIALDGCGQGAVELQEGSPVAGIQYLGSLEDISVVIHVKCGLGSNIESSCRDAIVRHPKREAIQIHLECIEYGQNGLRVNTGR